MSDEGLGGVVASAQKVAGVVAARHRGDRAGAADLLGSFESEGQMAAGALTVAELALGMIARETGQSMDECVRQLCLDLEQALRRRAG